MLLLTGKVLRAAVYETKERIVFRQMEDGVVLQQGEVSQAVDYVVELTMK